MGLNDTSRRGRWASCWVLLIGAVAIVGTAGAQTYVVDTGPGANTGGLSLTRNQYLAGQFTLDLGHEINGLEGWMIYPTITGDLPVYAVLYGDAGGVPDLANEIHSQLFLVPASGIPFVSDWHGIGGLEIPVYGGRPYWLAFEVPTEDFGSGAMPPTPLQELDLYAIDSGAGYTANTTARLGIRVLPEPALAASIVFGGAGLILLSRGRARAREADHGSKRRSRPPTDRDRRPRTLRLAIRARRLPSCSSSRRS